MKPVTSDANLSARGLTAVLGAIAAFVLPSVAQAAEPRVGRYVQYDAGDFTIISSRSANQARRFMEDLAKFRVTLEKTLGKRATRTVFPTTIFIASSADWKKYLMPRENVTGFFQQGHFANYMAMDGDSPQAEATHVIFHEYTHFYLASQFAGEYPPWFNEGLAELMGFAKFTDEGFAVMQVPVYRVHSARDGNWIPFDRLIKVSMNDPEYQSHTLADNFYSQAWLTVHYGFVENRDFGRQITTYLNELNTLHPHAEAARTAFGADLAIPDQQLREYSRNKSFSSGAIKLGEISPVSLAEGRPIAPDDALALLADLMIEAHAFPDRVRPLVAALDSHEPKAARSAILSARLAQLDQDNAAFDAAVARAESLLAADDWLQRRELASVLLASASEFSPLNQRTSTDKERAFQRAMKWFGEAIRHNSEDVEALWGFGSAATQLEKNLDVAEQALLAAYRKAPGSADIAMSLAILKSHMEQPDEMIPYLKDTIRYAGNHSALRWAKETLAYTERYIADRDRNAAEAQKQREEYEKVQAQYWKKRGKPKS